MPKAILEFELPEELTQHVHCLNAPRYWAALVAFNEWLRSQSDDDSFVKTARLVLKEYLEHEGIDL